jgi:DNA-binding Xre family transcriptional regulator
MSTFKQHLKQLRKDIFNAAFDEDICGFATVNELADAAGLSWQTVDNLYRGKTFEPRHSTIFKLCKAIQMDINLVEENYDTRGVRR